MGITVYNDQVVVADTCNHRIRMIDMNTREVSTLAGSGRHGRKDGPSEDASFNNPKYVAVYNDQIIVTDTDNHRIRLIDMNTREVSTLAGSGRAEWKDGQGEDASFYHPMGISVYNDQIIVADTNNHRIRLIDMSTREVSTLGNGRKGWKDGKGEEASFNWPFGVAIYNDQIIVADTLNNRIRLIDIKSRMVSTLAGIDRGEWKYGRWGISNYYNNIILEVPGPLDITIDPLSGRVFVITERDKLLMLDDCFTGVLKWELYVKQLFLDTSIPNPIIDIILMYCNYNFRRTLSPC
jgi:hypothetical protein